MARAGSRLIRAVMVMCLALGAMAGQASAMVYTLAPTDDAYTYYWWDWPMVNASRGGNGTAATLVAEYYYSQGNRTNIKHAFLKFDLSTIPNDATIDSAVLELYADSSRTAPNIYRANDGWTESSISWDSEPGTDGLLVAGGAWPTGAKAQEWLSFSFASAWTPTADLADDALSIELVGVGNGNNATTVRSKEYAGDTYTPRLVIETSGGSGATLPEPASLTLMGLGLAAAAWRRRRRARG